MMSIAILGWILPLFPFPVQSTPEPSLEEKLLATIPEDLDASKGGASFSPTGSAVAFWGMQEKAQVVVQGGRRSEPWVDINNLFWSADGTTFAYVANKGGTLDQFGLVKGGKFCVVINGTPSEYYDQVVHLTLSPQGKAAYVVTIAGKRHQVVDGKPGDPWYNVWEAVFSPDGKRLAYVIEEAKNKAFVWCDGERGPRFDSCYFLLFSRDNRVLAYSAREGSHSFMVVDGKRGENYDDVGWPALSADGKVVAYCATLNKRQYLVVGDRKSTDYDRTEFSLISPDGKTAACKAKIGAKWAMLLGDRPGPECDRVGMRPTFSADGTRLGYAGKRNNKWAVFDGEKFSEDFTFAASPVFSPTGKHVAFPAEIDGKRFIVAGSKRSDPFDSVDLPHFSADGRKVAFGARKGRELWWKVMEVE